VVSPGSASAGYVPERGDVVWVDLNPQAGHGQAGRRPALVLSPASYNGLVGLAIVCPITNQTKGYPFEVDILPGLPVTGVVLADQVRSLDWRVRKVAFFCAVPQGVVEDVLYSLGLLL
jgi:mRNA interferase MazF